MAARLRWFLRTSNPVFSLAGRQFTTNSLRQPKSRYARLIGVAFGTGMGLYVTFKWKKITDKPVILAKEAVEAEPKPHSMQTQRELRFLSFASVEYGDAIYMTPQDFLESITEELPRPRTRRILLQEGEIVKFLKNTTPRWKGSSHLFRNINDQGLISYTEYLFLLCVLTKPRSGFRIAFNMFDMDGNERVDKKEFLVLLDVFERAFISRSIKATAVQPNMPGNIWQIITQGSLGKKLERIITRKVETDSSSQSRLMHARRPKEDRKIQDTSLLVHFFGKKGNEVLKFEDFQGFMENLQTEVLELEFNEFAKGMASITEEEFARILLRYTILSDDDQQEYITRLNQRIPHVKGITFQDFKEFGQFLNNLDQFAVAMRLYTYADHPVTEDEFKRAVQVCTGQNLNNHLVHTVFQLFDIDGDGHLSSKEFISVMKDRLHRGFKSHPLNQTKWELFRGCVKNEMKAS